MAKTKADIESEVVEESITHFDMAYKSQQEIRLKCLQDRRFVFVDGAQWEDGLRLQFDNKPRFEVNKLHMACVRIFNEYRANRISVAFDPTNDDADKQTAEMLEGAYRHDERHSGGQEAYDNAFEEGVAGGMGAWRLRNVYADEDDEDDDTQKIVIEPIYDADSSVFFSLDGKRYDKSDAGRCWVITSMSRDEYAEKWGEPPEDDYGLPSTAQGTSFRKVQKMTEFDWYTPDVIYVAEYYVKEEKKKKVLVYRLPGQNKKDRKFDESELTEQDRQDMLDQGYQHIRTRTVKARRVHKWIHDGSRVLEDCGIIAGPNIPIVPFYGKRAYIDNQERIMSHIRLGKDAQRLFNMQISLLAMISALSPRRKPIFTPEQMRGHAVNWANDNIDDNPFLLINGIDNGNGGLIPAGPIGYTEPPNVPEPLAALMQLTDASIKELTGNQEAGEQVASNISDALMERVQDKVDMMAFIYMDNMSKSIQRSGEIWLGMFREIADEDGRKIPTLGEDGKRGVAVLRQPRMVDGASQMVNDPSRGKFQVTVDTGPAFKSRRDKTVRSLVAMLQYVDDPQLKQIITSLALTNMDGEGIDDLQEFLRMQLVQMGVVKPTDDEKKKLEAIEQQKANQPPDPQSQYFLAAAQREGAAAGKDHAQTFKTLIDAENSRADAIAKLANARQGDLQNAIQVLQLVMAQTQQDAAGSPAVQ
ncbi:portal protein [Burkholderia gladioli]|uniref:portal protein n=1 Tax=Burkholderia gladioli TaxID=28095 RepID=UPI00163E2B64|nr:portal protein [Burkholderia gladioli]